MTTNRAFLAFGANIPGVRGDPASTLRHFVAELEMYRVYPAKISSLYLTKPAGGVPQPDYFNCVIEARSGLGPFKLIQIFKELEVRAGRRVRARNSARPLDIDLLDYGGRIIGWPPSPVRQRIVLPHPELHRRLFVLAPLAEVAPRWHHPVLDKSVAQLINGLRGQHREISRLLDPGWISCEN